MIIEEVPTMKAAPASPLMSKVPEVTWTAADGAAMYHLTVSTAADCSTIVQQEVDLTDTSLTLDPLADGTYYICVTSEDLATNETDAANNRVSFTVDTSPPLPDNLIFATSFQTYVSTDSSVPPLVPDRFGGIAAADWVCTNAAFVAGLIPTWNGSDIYWHAILSTLQRRLFILINCLL